MPEETTKTETTATEAIEETNIAEEVEVDTNNETTQGEDETVVDFELEDPDFVDEDEVNPIEAVKAAIKESLAEKETKTETKQAEGEEDKPLTRKELEAFYAEQERIRNMQYEAQANRKRLLDANTQTAENYLDQVDEKLAKSGIDPESSVGKMISRNSEYLLKELISQRQVQLSREGKYITPSEINRLTRVHWNEFKESLKGFDLNFKGNAKETENLSSVGTTVTTRPAKLNADQQQLKDLREKAETGKLSAKELLQYKKIIEVQRRIKN